MRPASLADLNATVNGSAQLTIAGDSVRASLGVSNPIQAGQASYSVAVYKFNTLDPDFDFMAFACVGKAPNCGEFFCFFSCFFLMSWPDPQLAPPSPSPFLSPPLLTRCRVPPFALAVSPALVPHVDHRPLDLHP